MCVYCVPSEISTKRKTERGEKINSNNRFGTIGNDNKASRSTWGEDTQHKKKTYNEKFNPFGLVLICLTKRWKIVWEQEIECVIEKEREREQKSKYLLCISYIVSKPYTTPINFCQFKEITTLFFLFSCYFSHSRTKQKKWKINSSKQIWKNNQSATTTTTKTSKRWRKSKMCCMTILCAGRRPSLAKPFFLIVIHISLTRSFFFQFFKSQSPLLVSSSSRKLN